MTSPVGWDVDDPQTGAWVDLLATFARSQALGGDPLASPVWRGDDDVVPGRAGRIPATSIVDAGRIVIPIVLRGANEDGSVPADLEAAFLDNWRDMRRLLYRRGGFQLRRRLRYPTGVENHVGTAKIQPGSLTPGMVSTFHGRCVLEVGILSGYLYDEAQTDITPGTVTVGGDDETRKMQLSLPSAGTLANTTMGVSVTVDAGNTLDVEGFTASGSIAGIDWSGDDHWFALAPGSNTITWSGTGTPHIFYQAAHL